MLGRRTARRNGHSWQPASTSSSLIPPDEVLVPCSDEAEFVKDVKGLVLLLVPCEPLRIW